MAAAPRNFGSSGGPERACLLKEADSMGVVRQFVGRPGTSSSSSSWTDSLNDHQPLWSKRSRILRIASNLIRQSDRLQEETLQYRERLRKQDEVILKQKEEYRKREVELGGIMLEMRYKSMVQDKMNLQMIPPRKLWNSINKELDIFAELDKRKFFEFLPRKMLESKMYASVFPVGHRAFAETSRIAFLKEAERRKQLRTDSRIRPSMEGTPALSRSGSMSLRPRRAHKFVQRSPVVHTRGRSIKKGRRRRRSNGQISFVAGTTAKGTTVGQVGVTVNANVAPHVPDSSGSTRQLSGTQPSQHIFLKSKKKKSDVSGTAEKLPAERPSVAQKPKNAGEGTSEKKNGRVDDLNNKRSSTLGNGNVLPTSHTNLGKEAASLLKQPAVLKTKLKPRLLPKPTAINLPIGLNSSSVGPSASANGKTSSPTNTVGTESSALTSVIATNEARTSTSSGYGVSEERRTSIVDRTVVPRQSTVNLNVVQSRFGAPVKSDTNMTTYEFYKRSVVQESQGGNGELRYVPQTAALRTPGYETLVRSSGFRPNSNVNSRASVSSSGGRTQDSVTARSQSDLSSTAPANLIPAASTVRGGEHVSVLAANPNAKVVRQQPLICSVGAAQQQPPHGTVIQNGRLPSADSSSSHWPSIAKRPRVSSAAVAPASSRPMFFGGQVHSGSTQPKPGLSRMDVDSYDKDGDEHEVIVLSSDDD